MNILADTFVFKKHNTKVTFKVYIFGQGDSFIDMIVDFNIFLSMRRNTWSCTEAMADRDLMDKLYGKWANGEILVIFKDLVFEISWFIFID